MFWLNTRDMLFLVIATIVVLTLLILTFRIPIRVIGYFSLEKGSVLVRIKILNYAFLRVDCLLADNVTLLVNGKTPKRFKKTEEKSKITKEQVIGLLNRISFNRITLVARCGTGDASQTAGFGVFLKLAAQNLHTICENTTQTIVENWGDECFDVAGNISLSISPLDILSALNTKEHYGNK